MPYIIEYFHPKVRGEIESWPVGVLADYARLVELLVEFVNGYGFKHRRRQSFIGTITTLCERKRVRPTTARYSAQTNIKRFIIAREDWPPEPLRTDFLQLDRHVVEQVSDSQLLAQRGSIE